MIPKPGIIDLTPFKESNAKPETKYGLPEEIAFCKRCIISNQRPNSAVEYKHAANTRKATIHFDDEGICDACRVAEEKPLINWDDREKELTELCDRFRRDDGRHDCVVPGSGGKDSFYAAHMLKYKYGMHPLTVTWAPHLYTDWGWRNQQSWIHAGFDNFLLTPNGRVHRLLTRLAVENLFHPFQPFIIGQKALAARMSVLFDIPLVFFGENEAEYGNPKQDMADAKRSTNYYALDKSEEVYLSGVSVSRLNDEFGIDPSELEFYYPTEPERLEAAKTEVHYLGYYLRWHPQSCYYYAREHGGFEPSPERTPGTYSKYNSIDDKIDDYHYYTTYIKFGIGRATYDAAQEIRSGDIEREEGVALVKRFDGEYPDRFEDEIFRYLSIPEKEFPIASKQFEEPTMDRDYFMMLADKFRSPHLWQHGNEGWKLRKTVFSDNANDE